MRMQVLELEKCVDRLLRMQIESSLSPGNKAWDTANPEAYNTFTNKEKDMADFCKKMDIVENLNCKKPHSIKLRSDNVLIQVRGNSKTVTPTLFFKNDESILLKFRVCKDTKSNDCAFMEKLGSYDEVKNKLIDIYFTNENSSFFRDIIPYSDSIWARLWRGFPE